jgi:hypothetical protein
LVPVTSYQVADLVLAVPREFQPLAPQQLVLQRGRPHLLGSVSVPAVPPVLRIAVRPLVQLWPALSVPIWPQL